MRFGKFQILEKCPGPIFQKPAKNVFEKIQLCPDPNSHFLPSIKLFHIYGKMDLEKLITTNPIWDFFTETFDLLSATTATASGGEAVAVAVAGWGIWPRWDSSRKNRLSNGLAYNKSKLSVKKSQSWSAVINFSRSIFPYMWNNFMDG